MKKFLFNYLLSPLLYGIIYLWCLTIRTRRLNREREEYVQQLPDQYILTLWHGRIFYLFYYLRNRPDFHLLISPSADGDLLARLAQLMGYSVVRGSSYKKAVSSARSLIKILRQHQRIIMIADGSRGPRCKAQPGSLLIGGITGAPVIPMTFGSNRNFIFNSWDRFVLPLPFSRCTINFGDPLVIGRKESDEKILAKQNQLENALNQLAKESDSQC
jgi:lysophospholipid acyltransferase (LPLAT)-like uncharacterized protein